MICEIVRKYRRIEERQKLLRQWVSFEAFCLKLLEGMSVLGVCVIYVICITSIKKKKKKKKKKKRTYITVVTKKGPKPPQETFKTTYNLQVPPPGPRPSAILRFCRTISQFHNFTKLTNIIDFYDIFLDKLTILWYSGLK